MNISATPFNVEPADVIDNHHHETIELQRNHELKPRNCVGIDQFTT